MRTVVGPVPLFDPRAQSMRAETMIVIENERVVDVLEGTRAVPGVDRTVDTAGAVALPGLIDSHVHLCYDGVPARFSDPTAPAGILAALAIQAMSRHLDAGVTTVRDCGAPDGIVTQLRDAIAAGYIDGPRILAAGRMLTMTGGHGSQIGRLVDGADSGTRGARAEIAEGADFIKLMVTGGVVTKGVRPEQVALRPAEIAAIVDAAHDAGRRVTAHSTGPQGARNAVHAGVDSVEHGLGIELDTAREAAQRGVFVIPTLITIRRTAESAENVPEWMREKAVVAVDEHARSFQRMLEAGVPIAVGTDGGTPYNPHGSIAAEIELLTESGMGPASALAAATLGSAQNLGIDDHVGVIEPGYAADLVLVDENPIDNPGALRRPRTVIVRGRIVRERAGDRAAG